MKKIVLLLIISLFLYSCSESAPILKLVTGSTGGNYYPLGNAIAETLSEQNDDYTINAYTGNASVKNTDLIGKHEADMALVQSNVAYWAYNGFGMFEDEPVTNIRGIASLYSEMIQVIVRKDSGIKSIIDLKNRNVSLGLPDSGNYFDALNILEAYNLNSDDFNLLEYSFSDAVKGMKNGLIDAVFFTSGIPTSSVIAMSGDIEIDIIEIDAEILFEMIEEDPYYSYGLIPSDTYRGITKDVNTLSTRALWLCDADMDEDIVYRITKDFWENRKDIQEATDIAKSVLIDDAIEGMSIPLHPGALKYYKEIGIEVD